MPFVPTKAHKSVEIPNLMGDIEVLLKQFKKDTGADDRYISLILGAMMNEYTHKSRRERENLKLLINSHFQ